LLGKKAPAYINLVVALYSIVPLLSLLITMAFLYKLRDILIKGDYFLSFDDLLKVIRDASVKHKFSFKVLYSDIIRV
jgi:hypothetical protein